MTEKRSYYLVSVQIMKKEENMVDIEYYTADGKQPIVHLCVHESELPPIDFDQELSSDNYTALLQLLLTPFGHVNVLERWLNWASNTTKSFSDIIPGTVSNADTTPKMAVEQLISDTRKLLNG